MNKTIAIVFLCLTLGYWTGNLMTTNRVNEQAQQLNESEKNYTLASNALLQCEQKYVLLKNGQVAKADDIEKKQDNGSGW